MHLGNGAITPGCAAITLTAAGAGLTTAVLALRRKGIDQNRLLTAGAMSSALFAAQMVNVPVLPFSSGHLVGGVLAAWVLGPALGAISMAIVLATQSLVLGDGGFMAWGANVINMGLVPALCVSIVRRRCGATTAGLTAGLAIVAAAVLILAETALFRPGDRLAGFGAFSLEMLAIHVWIAVPEGLLTVAILKVLGGIRAPGELRLDQTRLAGCWGTALLLVLCMLPYASRMPDGYETAAERNGMHALLAEGPAQLAAVASMNAVVASWQDKIVTAIQGALASEQLIALLATMVVGLAVWGTARLVAKNSGKPA